MLAVDGWIVTHCFLVRSGFYYRENDYGFCDVLKKDKSPSKQQTKHCRYYVTFPGSVYACANRPSFGFLFGMALWQLLRNQILYRDVQSHTGRHACHCKCCSPASGGICNAGDEIKLIKLEILISLDMMHFFLVMNYWFDRPILTCCNIKDDRHHCQFYCGPPWREPL